MHVTQEGPDVLSRYCSVQAFGRGETANTPGEPAWKLVKRWRIMTSSVASIPTKIFTSLVDELDRVLESRCFATTREHLHPCRMPANACSISEKSCTMKSRPNTPRLMCLTPSVRELY